MGRWALQSTLGIVFLYIHCILARYTAEEVIALLEEERHFDSTDIFLKPPSDGQETGDDDAAPDDRGTVNDLSRRQLCAPSTATVSIGDENMALSDYCNGSGSDSSDDPEPSTSTCPPPTGSERDKWGGRRECGSYQQKGSRGLPGIRGVVTLPIET